MDAARRSPDQPLPPETHWAARVRFVGGSSVYVVAIIVALFNAIAAFVLIALVAVYYIVERTPPPPPPRLREDESPLLNEARQVNSCH